MEKRFKFVNVIINEITDENEKECIIENADVEQIKDWNCLCRASKFIEFIENNVYLEDSISTSVYFNNYFHGSNNEWSGFWFWPAYDYIEVFFRSVNTIEKETYTEEQIELEITLHSEK